MFMAVARQLIETGKVTRAYLGVSLDGKFGPAMAAESGLPGLIGARVHGRHQGLAGRSGPLQVGDIILEVNHIAVEDDAHLDQSGQPEPVGRQVSLGIFRDGKMLRVAVTVSDRNRFESARSIAL